MTNASDGLPPLREVVQHHGLLAKRSLGQNFLFDLNLTRRIARAAGPLEGVTCIEIGPGPGGLTRALLSEGARHVVAVERDERCLAALGEIAEHFPGRLTIVAGDALTTDLAALASAQGAGRPDAPARIVANLPYNIGTALLTQWLEFAPWPPWYDRLTLMFQREVAERIVATVAERSDYGRLAVLCGWRTNAKILFDVPPSAFTPPPKIVSSIVELRPLANPLPCNGKLLAAVTLAAFGQRRKMLRQALRSLAWHDSAAGTAELLERTGIDPTARAEELHVPQFVALANVYGELRGAIGDRR